VARVRLRLRLRVRVRVWVRVRVRVKVRVRVRVRARATMTKKKTAMTILLRARTFLCSAARLRSVSAPAARVANLNREVCIPIASRATAHGEMRTMDCATSSSTTP